MVFLFNCEKKTTSIYRTVFTVPMNYFSWPSKSLEGPFTLTSRAWAHEYV